MPTTTTRGKCKCVESDDDLCDWCVARHIGSIIGGNNTKRRIAAWREVGDAPSCERCGATLDWQTSSSVRVTAKGLLAIFCGGCISRQDTPLGRTHGQSAYSAGCRCDVCCEGNREYSRQWYAKHPERAREIARQSRAQPHVKTSRRDYRLMKEYGITQEMFEGMVESQGGGCALCGRHADEVAKGLVVDHCHATGKIRGVLCGPCNNALGLLLDNPETCENAAAYLRGADQ